MKRNQCGRKSPKSNTNETPARLMPEIDSWWKTRYPHHTHSTWELWRTDVLDVEVLRYNTSTNRRPGRKKRINQQNEEANWHRFTRKLERNISPTLRMEADEDTKEATKNLTEVVKKKINKNTRSITVPKINKYGEIPVTLKQLIRKQNRARRTSQRRRQPDDKRTAKRAFRFSIHWTCIKHDR